MSDEELNIAICEWRGWKLARDTASSAKYKSRRMWTNPKLGLFATTGSLPSHITGIEALGNLHEAEKELTREQLQGVYKASLIDVVFDISAENRGIAFATAHQRAIALLRVVKPEIFARKPTDEEKWIETKQPDYRP